MQKNAKELIKFSKIFQNGQYHNKNAREQYNAFLPKLKRK